MIISLKKTKHETTKEEQFKKVIEELAELKVAIDEFKAYGSRDERYDLYLIDEALDTAKAMQKHANSNLAYDISYLTKTSADYFDCFEYDLQLFQENKTANYAELAITTLLKYLFKFCEENNIDFQEQIEKNDDKNEVRGYHK